MKLELPRIAERPDPSIEVRAVYVEEWVEGLAYANPPRLLAQVLGNLQALNTQPLRPALRMQLLELHLVPYRFSLDFRRTQLPAITSTSLRRQRNISDALREIAMAMAMGYKQALSEITSRQGRFGSNRDTRVLLQRSGLFTALALLHCYDAYRSPAAGLWDELIALYMFAAKEGMDGRNVSAPVDDELFTRSPSHIFKRLCLSSLVDPYHLAYGDLWRVFGAFAALADDCQILEVHEIPRPAGHFVIDSGSDRAPTPLGRNDTIVAQRCRLLDANSALRALEQRHRSGRSTAELPPRLLATMLRSLGLPPRRHTPREGSEGRLVVCLGLGATHHFRSGGEAADANRPAVVQDENDIHVSAVGDELDFTASYTTENWKIIDEGPSGLGMSRDTPPQLPVGVGDLVGLQFPLRGDAKDDWTIAVVRWIHVMDDDDYQAGVQILAPNAMPLTVQQDSLDDNADRLPSAALALPGIDNNPSSTVILPRGMFTPSTLLRAVGGGLNVLIRLGARSESTGSFERYTFEIME